MPSPASRAHALMVIYKRGCTHCARLSTRRYLPLPEEELKRLIDFLQGEIRPTIVGVCEERGDNMGGQAFTGHKNGGRIPIFFCQVKIACAMIETMHI